MYSLITQLSNTKFPSNVKSTRYLIIRKTINMHYIHFIFCLIQITKLCTTTYIHIYQDYVTVLINGFQSTNCSAPSKLWQNKNFLEHQDTSCTSFIFNRHLLPRCYSIMCGPLIAICPPSPYAKSITLLKLAKIADSKVEALSIRNRSSQR